MVNPSALQLLHALLLCLPFSGPPGDGPRDVVDALDRLASPVAIERFDAERWLAVHLVPAHFPLLSEAAAGGDAELRLRLVRALAADPAHFELAALLATEPVEAARELGSQALAELAGRWNPALFEPPLGDEVLLQRLEARRERLPGEPILLQLDGPPGEVLDRLGRLAAVPVGLVLDPSLERWSGRPPGTFAYGTWDQVVAQLAQAYGVTAEGFGLPERVERDPRPIVRLRHPFDPSWSTGAERLVFWVQMLAEGGDPGERRAAARALATSGWPAALTWLGERARVQNDAAALDGVLAAAARGRELPGFFAGPVLASLVRQADAGFEGRPLAGRPVSLQRAHEILWALAAASPVEPSGEALARTLLDGWDALGPRGRWWRLAALEGQAAAPPDLDPSPGRIAGDLILAPAGGHPPALLLQALRTAAALPALAGDPGGLRGRVPGDPEGLLAAPRNSLEFRELAALLQQLGLRPPETWKTPPDPGNLAPSVVQGRLLCLVEWWLAAGEPAAAAEHLRAVGALEPVWPAPPNPAFWMQARATETLLEIRERGGGEALAALFGELEARPATAAEEQALLRLRLLAGGLSAAGREAVLDLLEALPLGADPVALGVLAAAPQSARARDLLLEALEAAIRDEGAPPGTDPAPQPDPELLFQGLRRALEELRARGADGEVAELRRRITRIAARRPRHPLAARLLGDWEGPPRFRAWPLSNRDRVLDPALPRDG